MRSYLGAGPAIVGRGIEASDHQPRRGQPEPRLATLTSRCGCGPVSRTASSTSAGRAAADRGVDVSTRETFRFAIGARGA